MKRSVSGSSAPSPATKRSRTVESTPEPAVSFPRFRNGSIEIIVSEKDERYQYQLHRSTLEESSGWFRTSIRDTVSKLPRPAPGEVVRLCYVLEKANEEEEPMLVYKKTLGVHFRNGAGSWVTLDADMEADQHREDDQEVTGEADPTPRFKKEPRTHASRDDLTSPTLQEADRESETPELTTERFETYNNLFLTFCNLPPLLSRTSISDALSQTESLICLATIYSSFATIRSHVGNLLSEHRQALYTSIAENPFRWVKVGVALESSTIFTEAVIHLAGMWPLCPWLQPERSSSIPPKVLDLVVAKAKALANKRAKVDRELFLGTGVMNGREIIRPSSSSSFSSSSNGYVVDANFLETWTAVQIFRDWLAQSISAARASRSEHVAPYYRLLRKGGNAYLPYEEVLKVLEALPIDDGSDVGTWQGLAEDLTRLKKRASGVVKHICKNNLMLSEQTTGIEYLTCTEVGMEDLPWFHG
ncbi:MAG: hypothetical protein M1837_005637 [Sclerophora amabilis]|nr:MAG: hypothetical protein M1837_005637 [Sclerophora amabilis]